MIKRNNSNQFYSRSCSMSLLLFPLALLFLFPFCSIIPTEASVSQKLRCVVRNVVSINHRVRTQQVNVPLRFRRWWRPWLFSTFLSSFPWRASTTSSASTSAFPRFPHFSRLMTCRLREIKYTQFVLENRKSKQTAGKPLKCTKPFKCFCGYYSA